VKLIRLVTLSFGSIKKEWMAWRFQVGEVTVETMSYLPQEKDTKIIVYAAVPLDKLPEVNGFNLVIIPQDKRRLAELALEAMANLMSVSYGCSRKIASPSPSVALMHETNDELSWVRARRAIDVNPGLSTGATRLISPEKTLELLYDRPDGLSLLSEALSHSHVTGRFHELMRLFERAFTLSSSKLIPRLSDYLSATTLGYCSSEINDWIVKYRHPATHADRRKDFLLESDIRPIIDRVEQAAYDVLFNKKKWRSTSTDRRDFWIPETGTSAPSGELFLKRGTETAIVLHLLDAFSAYPQDLSACLKKLPDGWWAEFESAKDQEVV
jgi:hypothetical protein